MFKNIHKRKFQVNCAGKFQQHIQCLISLKKLNSNHYLNLELYEFQNIATMNFFEMVNRNTGFGKMMNSVANNTSVHLNLSQTQTQS